VSLRLAWPQSLASRTLLLLLVTGLVVYIAGILAYQLLAEEAAERDRIEQIADRLGAAMDALAAVPPRDREAAARELSSASFRITWNTTSLVDDLSHSDPGLQKLRQRLIQLTPGLASREFHLRWDEHALAGVSSIVLGAAELTDHSYVIFSAAIIPTAVASLPGAFFVASVVFASIIVVAAFVLRTINAPLRRLADAAHHYGHDRSVPLPERGPREIVEVERAFNAMQHRIHRLITDLTQALAAVSHDLRTPIARLRLRCGLLTDRALQAECEGDLAEMDAMVESILASMLATLVDTATDAGHNAVLSGPSHAVVTVHGLTIKRALANLIDNATTYGGSARVKLEQTSEHIRITIDDDGPGIAESEMARVFEPFCRLEASRNPEAGGVGLGLTIARRAIEREGGSIRLRNQPGGGLRVEVRLPLHPDGGKTVT
jgi:signal transduction histidine kinase